MIIALDFDNSYTCDPEFWDQVIKSAEARNHQVLICTYRASTHPVGSVPVPVYYSAGKAKKPYLESRGIRVDVFIDDNSYAINFDEDYKPS